MLHIFDNACVFSVKYFNLSVLYVNMINLPIRNMAFTYFGKVNKPEISGELFYPGFLSCKERKLEQLMLMVKQERVNMWGQRSGVKSIQWLLIEIKSIVIPTASLGAGYLVTRVKKSTIVLGPRMDRKYLCLLYESYNFSIRILCTWQVRQW